MIILTEAITGLICGKSGISDAGKIKNEMREVNPKMDNLRRKYSKETAQEYLSTVLDIEVTGLKSIHIS